MQILFLLFSCLCLALNHAWAYTDDPNKSNESLVREDFYNYLERRLLNYPGEVSNFTDHKDVSAYLLGGMDSGNENEGEAQEVEGELGNLNNSHFIYVDIASLKSFMDEAIKYRTCTVIHCYEVPVVTLEHYKKISMVNVSGISQPKLSLDLEKFKTYLGNFLEEKKQVCLSAQARSGNFSRCEEQALKFRLDTFKQLGIDIHKLSLTDARAKKQVAGGNCQVAICSNGLECDLKHKYPNLENSNFTSEQLKEKICFQPQAKNSDCIQNPTCIGKDIYNETSGEVVRREGLMCMPNFNFTAASVGACKNIGLKCSSSNDCCSGVCVGGSCKWSMKCKNVCIGVGEKVKNNLPCCENLVNQNGVCIFDLPPTEGQNLEALLQSILSTSNMENASVSQASSVFQSRDTSMAAMTDLFNKKQKEILEKEMSSKTIGSADKSKELKSEMDMAFAAIQELYKGSYGEKRPYTKLTPTQFKTCDIRFENDFKNFMMESGSFDSEAALVAFEAIASGDGTDELWKVDGKSIHDKAKELTVKSKKIRDDFKVRLKKIGEIMTCKCLGILSDDLFKNKEIGLAKLEAFQKQCAQPSYCDGEDFCADDFIKYQERIAKIKEKKATGQKEESGDASGALAYKLLATWSEKLSQLNMDIGTERINLYSEVADVGKKVTELEYNKYVDKNWDQPEAFGSTYLLQTAHKKTPRGWVKIFSQIFSFAYSLITFQNINAVSDKLLGFMGYDMKSYGGSGENPYKGEAYFEAMIKGAFGDKKPKIYRYNYEKRKTWKSIKHTAYYALRHQFNDVCRIHASSNACIHTMMIGAKDGEEFYILDPWYPAGTKREEFVTDTSTYAKRIEDGFQAVLSKMKNINPGKNINWQESLIPHDIELFYRGGFENHINNHRLTEERINKIKAAFIDYAKKEELFSAETNTATEENYKMFAEYGLVFHFIYPHMADTQFAIAYPSRGTYKYYDVVSNGVLNTLINSSFEVGTEMKRLQLQYLKGYKATLESYADSCGNASASGGCGNELNGMNITDEMKRVDQQINGIQAFASQIISPNVRNGSGLSGGSNSNMTGTAGANSGNSSSTMSALSRYFAKQKANAKKLEDWKKRNSKNPYANRILASNGVLNTIYNKGGTRGIPTNKGKLGIINGDWSVNSTLSRGSDENKTSLLDKAKESAENLKNNLLSAINGGSSSGSSSSSSSGEKMGDFDGLNSDLMSGGSKNANLFDVSSKDDQEVLNAINARNSENENKYKRKSDDDQETLWNIVTKAYLRNYDRLLKRKKPSFEK